MRHMSDKLTCIQRANGKALRNLKKLQDATVSFQSDNITKSSSSTSTKLSISTSSSLKGRADTKHHVSTAPPLDSILKKSGPTDISDLSTPSEISKTPFVKLSKEEQAEIRKKRNQRQRMNRKKRKLECRDATNKEQHGGRPTNTSNRSSRKDKK